MNLHSDDPDAEVDKAIERAISAIESDVQSTR